MYKRADKSNRDVSRRQFLRTSSLALAGGAAAVAHPFVNPVHAAGSDFEVKIGLIGCGGRGSGAVLNALGAASKSTYPQSGYHTEDVAQGAPAGTEGFKVVALADLFEDRLTHGAEQLAKLGIKIPKAMRFTGFDAYQAVAGRAGGDLRGAGHSAAFPAPAPEGGDRGRQARVHGEARGGRRARREDGDGGRRVGQAEGAGHRRRHAATPLEELSGDDQAHPRRRDRRDRLRPLLLERGEIWYVDRQPGWSDVEYQIRNWNYFTWLSGDHYVEQHVHNLDVMNWVLGTHPIRVVSGVGGRQVRTGKQYGNVYDHFAVEYEYPNGVRMFSQARQINGCDNLVEEAVVGTQGVSNCRNLSSRRAATLGISRAASRIPIARNTWTLSPAFARASRSTRPRPWPKAR